MTNATDSAKNREGAMEQLLAFELDGGGTVLVEVADDEPVSSEPHESMIW